MAGDRTTTPPDPDPLDDFPPLPSSKSKSSSPPPSTPPHLPWSPSGIAHPHISRSEIAWPQILPSVNVQPQISHSKTARPQILPARDLAPSAPPPSGSPPTHASPLLTSSETARPQILPARDLAPSAPPPSGSFLSSRSPPTNLPKSSLSSPISHVPIARATNLIGASLFLSQIPQIVPSANNQSQILSSGKSVAAPPAPPPSAPQSVAAPPSLSPPIPLIPVFTVLLGFHGQPG